MLEQREDGHESERAGALEAIDHAQSLGVIVPGCIDNTSAPQTIDREQKENILGVKIDIRGGV